MFHKIFTKIRKKPPTPMTYWSESEILKEYGFKPTSEDLQELITQHSLVDPSDDTPLHPTQLRYPYPRPITSSSSNSSPQNQNSELSSHWLWHPLHLPEFIRPAKHIEIISEPRVKKLEQSLSNIQSSTNHLTHVLDSLKTRLVDLSTRLASIHSVSQQMTQRNTIIEKELDSMSKYIKRFDVSASIPDLLSQGFTISSSSSFNQLNQTTSVSNFFDTLQQIEETLDFFNTHSYQDTDEMISFLESLLSQGVDYSVKSFSSFITTSSETVEFYRIYPPLTTHYRLYEYLEFASTIIHGDIKGFEKAIQNKKSSPFSSSHSISSNALEDLATLIHKFNHYERIEYISILSTARILFLTESLSFIDPWTSDTAFAFALKQETIKSAPSTNYESQSLRGELGNITNSGSRGSYGTQDHQMGSTPHSSRSGSTDGSSASKDTSTSQQNQKESSPASVSADVSPNTESEKEPLVSTNTLTSGQPKPKSNQNQNQTPTTVPPISSPPPQLIAPSTTIGPSLSSFLDPSLDEDIFDNPFDVQVQLKSPLNQMTKKPNRGTGSGVPLHQPTSSSKPIKTIFGKPKKSKSAHRGKNKSKPLKKKKKRSFSGASFTGTFGVPQNNVLSRSTSYSTIISETAFSSASHGVGNIGVDPHLRDHTESVINLGYESTGTLGQMNPISDDDSNSSKSSDHSPRSPRSMASTPSNYSYSLDSNAPLSPRSATSGNSGQSSESAHSLHSEGPGSLFSGLQLPQLDPNLKSKKRISFTIPRLSPRSTGSSGTPLGHHGGQKSGVLPVLKSSSPRRSSAQFEHTSTDQKVVVKQHELSELATNPMNALGIWSSTNWKNLEQEALATLQKITTYERPDRTRAPLPPGDYSFIYFLSVVAISLYSERQLLIRLLPRKLFPQVYSQISSSIMDLIGDASDTLLRRLESGERHPKENIFGMLHVLDHFYRMDPLFKMILSTQPTFITPNDIYDVNSVDDRDSLLSNWQSSNLYHSNISSMSEGGFSFSGTESSSAYQELLLTIAKCQITTERTIEELISHLTKHDPKSKIKNATVAEVTINTLAVCKTLLSFKSILGKIHTDSLGGTTGGDSQFGIIGGSNIHLDDTSTSPSFIHEPLVHITAHSSLPRELHPLRFLLLQMLDALFSHLAAKASVVSTRDPILSSLYLLNNYQHILQTILFHVEFDSTCDLHFHPFVGILGSQVLTNFTKRIDAYENLYIRKAFNTLFSLLQLPDEKKMEYFKTAVQNDKLSKADRHEIKDRFAAINSEFESLSKSQDIYIVNNPSLQQRISDLSISLIQPKYQQFLNFYRDIPFSQNRLKYEKYSKEDCQRIILGFLSNH